MANKLELTWFGKDEPISVEPRLLIENVELSNTAADPYTENMIIHGDNLLALKALESIGLTNYQFVLILWGILIIVSIVVELLTDELTIIWGTVGAIFALISAIFKAPIWLQLIIFIVCTIGFILLFRPIIKKHRKKEVIHTNADRLIGMVAIVSEEFKNGEVGKAIVNNQIWRAVSVSNETFYEGEKVQVEGLSGTKIVVSKINNERVVKL